jgi:N-acetyltransferase
MPYVNPVTLRGEHVVVEPLSESHLDGLKAAAADGELWNLWYTSVPEPENAMSNIQFRLNERASGRMMPFVVRRAIDNAIVGATTFCNIKPMPRRLEIGYTWYAKSAQRTAINTETKFLLLSHAFESLQCIAVELRTHHANVASRAAIEKLGAKYDGTLRNHGVDRRGGIRDTVVYSVIATEWPGVKARLRERLKQSC